MYRIDYSSDYSLHNWVQQYNLICESEIKIGAIGSAFFLGWASLAIILPYIADKKGRKYIIFSAFLVTVSGITPIIFASNVNLLLIFSFVMGLCATGRVAVGYVYVVEFLTPQWRLIFSTISNILYVMVFALTVFYLRFISK